MKRSTVLSTFTSRLALLGVMMFALALPGQVLAQVYVCGSNIGVNTGTADPYYINEAIPIVVTLGATDVNDGTDNGLLYIESFDFKPDCEIGSTFDTCSVSNNDVSIITADADIGGTCPGPFTTATPDGGLTYVFTPDSPVELAPQETCTVEFEIMVNDVASESTGILEWGGWVEDAISCTDLSGTPYPPQASSSASGSLFFTLSTLRTAFRVTKDFTDDGDAEAEVFLRCNSGLPLEQSFTLEDEEWVEFIVRDFVTGTTDCTVWEEPEPDGYEADYTAGSEPGAIFDTITDDDDGCYFNGLTGGTFTCDITNAIEEVRIEVNKQWLVSSDSNLDIDFVAQADYTCYDVYDSPAGGTLLPTVTGTLDFDGEYDTQFIGGLYPAADGSSYCTVSEPDLPDYVEADVSECAEVPVERGASCTLYNSVFFEGIPTLSHYGLALLSLLMLGMGVIAVRRFA